MEGTIEERQKLSAANTVNSVSSTWQLVSYKSLIITKNTKTQLSTFTCVYSERCKSFEVKSSIVNDVVDIIIILTLQCQFEDIKPSEHD